MKTTIEEKKREAVERMRLLNVNAETIAQFDNDGYISQSLPPVGGCYWIEGEQLERVREFEARYSGVVYHVLRNVYRELGEMETYLYVCDDPDEWDMDRDEIENGQAFAYVYNVSHPDLSEFGSVGVETTPAGGLLRTW